MQVYKITNLINNKIYIGQTVRKKKSYMGSGILIKQAIKKEGKENFKKEILLEVNTQKELDDAEIRFIKEYNSTNNDIGYNLNEGGQYESRTGTKLHEETKRKISQSLKGHKHTEESKKLMSEQRKGKNNPMYGNGDKVSGKKNGRYGGKGTTDETRQKISKARKGSTWSGDRKKQSERNSGSNNGMYGKTQYDIWVSKSGEEKADKKLSEFKEKISASQKGRKMSDEHKEKIRLARINYFKNKK